MNDIKGRREIRRPEECLRRRQVEHFNALETSRYRELVHDASIQGVTTLTAVNVVTIGQRLDRQEGSLLGWGIVRVVKVGSDKRRADISSLSERTIVRMFWDLRGSDYSDLYQCLMCHS